MRCEDDAVVHVVATLIDVDPIRSHRDLIVWQRARALAVECRRVCRQLHPEGQLVFTVQILRAAVSVGGNIAEGRGRLSKADNARHLVIALGSVTEVMSHLDFATAMDYIAEPRTTKAHALAVEVQSMLKAQIRKLGKRRL